MHHKRRRPKHQRAGCLLCKPHKDERLLKSVPLKGLRTPQPWRDTIGIHFGHHVSARLPYDGIVDTLTT